ncbi:MAG TPA: helix-turn-helix domain-containing protein [Verrucomicrobiae bacterium]|nr:helix-turn-helix domain-containing protein [Verrucomicrobiae bacterium]
MPTVAEQLRAARETQKLTVNQIADVTKVRADHIRAVEDGNYNVFSATVYIRGLVRSYATLLKLDVPRIMASLDAELKGTDEFSEPPPLAERARTPLDFVMLQLSKLDWRKGLIGLGTVVVLVAVVGLFALWRHHQNTDPLAGLQPGMYQSNSNLSGDMLPLPSSQLTR